MSIDRRTNGPVTNAKYLFDVDFNDRGAAERNEPGFTEADLAGAEERGRIAGLAQARTEAEHLAAQALGAIGRRLGEISAAQKESAAKTERTAVEIAAASMRKIFPAYAQRHGLDEIETVVKECLARVPDEPRVVVRVPEALLDPIQSRMANLAADAGFPGGLMMLADHPLGHADCRVEWADGGADRDTARLWSDIEACLARALTKRTEVLEPSAQPTDVGN